MKKFPNYILIYNTNILKNQVFKSSKTHINIHFRVHNIINYIYNIINCIHNLFCIHKKSGKIY